MEYSDIVKYWQKQHIKDSDDLRNILNGHIINFAYHSGKIENPNTSYDDTREIFENDAVCNYTGDLRTLYEIRNAKDAINIVLDVFDKHQPLTEEFIKKYNTNSQKILTISGVGKEVSVQVLTKSMTI